MSRRIRYPKSMPRLFADAEIKHYSELSDLVSLDVEGGCVVLHVCGEELWCTLEDYTAFILASLYALQDATDKAEEERKDFSNASVN